MKKPIKIILYVILALIVLAVISQLAITPLKTNPPVVSEPNWDSPDTRALVKRACFDCHSNETVWPWYSNVPPISWLVLSDTLGGRQRLNFSEWSSRPVGAGEIQGIVQEGEMPPAIYLVNHPEARLTPAEKQQMLDGLARTLGQ